MRPSSSDEHLLTPASSSSSGELHLTPTSSSPPLASSSSLRRALPHVSSSPSDSSPPPPSIGRTFSFSINPHLCLLNLQLPSSLSNKPSLPLLLHSSSLSNTTPLQDSNSGHLPGSAASTPATIFLPLDFTTTSPPSSSELTASLLPRRQSFSNSGQLQPRLQQLRPTSTSSSTTPANFDLIFNNSDQIYLVFNNSGKLYLIFNNSGQLSLSSHRFVQSSPSSKQQTCCPTSSSTTSFSARSSPPPT